MSATGGAPELPSPPFRLERRLRFASAGSCFARHVRPRLEAAGVAYVVTEPGGPYGARFGEIYTTLQLRQLAEHALGLRVSHEAPWRGPAGWHDPLRPRAAGPFDTRAALEVERRSHLAAVRALLEGCDVFVFTLGLTETWLDAEGTALPLCPGAGIGRFDPERYTFRNLSVEENVAHLRAFLALARSVNPDLLVVLTVSPVPLVATLEPRHVLEASVYSKSVLRVAAESVRCAEARVAYFPAYELIATGYGGDDAFEKDRREVRSEAVDRVMQSFLAWFRDGDEPLPAVELSLDAVAAIAAAGPLSDPCDEAYLARFTAP